MQHTLGFELTGFLVELAPVVTWLAYCIDKELYKAIDCLREQVRVLVEHQENQHKRIRLTSRQRMRVAAKAKRLRWKMLEQCTDHQQG